MAVQGGNVSEAFLIKEKQLETLVAECAQQIGEF